MLMMMRQSEAFLIVKIHRDYLCWGGGRLGGNQEVAY